MDEGDRQEEEKKAKELFYGRFSQRSSKRFTEHIN